MPENIERQQRVQSAIPPDRLRRALIPRPFPELWGTTEIAFAAAVSTGAVANWSRRHTVGKDPFPRPVARLAQGPVWLADEIRPWLQRRETARRRVYITPEQATERERVRPTDNPIEGKRT